MIESLYIKNFAIIDELQIDFHDDMNVLTGETGAGKSIIIDAIGQLIGNRTQLSFIKTGCDKAYIEGVFDIMHNQEMIQLLEEYDFEIDDKLVVSKAFQSDGRTTVKINYRTTSQTILKKIMPHLIDIHNQFDTHSLFDEKTHIQLLDRFIGEPIHQLLEKYQDKYRNYVKVKQQYQQLYEEELSDEQLDFYQSQLNEINQIDFDAINEDELEQEKRKLQDFEKINEKVQNYTMYMNQNQGVLTNLNSAIHELESLSDIDEYREVYDKLYDLYYELSDLDSEIEMIFNSSDFDEYRLNEIQELQFKINHLKRKYGYSFESILDAKKELEDKINGFKNRDQLLNDLLQQQSKLEHEVQTIADQITNLRNQEALNFEQNIKQELQDLYLEKVEFKIENTRVPFQNNGQDKITFMISTNVGQQLQPLQKIASGGELSRIMLAIKILSYQFSSISTIIFDEADTGVSGKVAEAIGKKMKTIASHAQVLVITHLSQVAAFAKYHYLIEKQDNLLSTNVSVSLLSQDDSIHELAKMISGKVVTKESIEHAKRLKNK